MAFGYSRGGGKGTHGCTPRISNEVVSMECGFSSRVYFQRLFKERTGLTPAEWRRQR